MMKNNKNSDEGYEIANQYDKLLDNAIKDIKEKISNIEIKLKGTEERQEKAEFDVEKFNSYNWLRN